MNLTYKIGMLALLLSVWGCQQEEEFKILEDNMIVGNWVNPQMVSDTLWQYDRATALVPSDYCFSFQSDLKFVERKNSGWCGTPPVAYGDFEGTWSQNDSTLNINVGFWGGDVDYKWKIISLDENKLTIYKVKEDYHYEEY